MNKKILITILIILGLTVISGGFWYAQKHIQDKNQEVVNNEQEMKNNDEQEKTEIVKTKNNQEKKDQEGKNKTEIENIKTSPQLSPEEIEKLKKEKDLVWYEIPELNIKFLVEKDIADVLRYRDFYIQDNKADGKELYIKDLYVQNNVKNPVVFADLIIDRAVKDTKTGAYHFLSEYCLGNKNIKILTTKKNSYRVCYLRKIDDGIDNLSYGQNNSLRNAAEKILQGYLEKTFVTLINNNH